MSSFTGTVYLNNRGSRWVVFNNGKREKIELQTKDGKTVVRTVNYYASFGNFVTANISYQGRKLNVFNDTILDGNK